MKKASKKRLKRMRLTLEQAEGIARRFVREQLGQDLPLEEPVKLSETRTNTWVALFTALGPDGQPSQMDPNVVIVLVEDASGTASFFPTL